MTIYNGTATSPAIGPFPLATPTAIGPFTIVWTGTPPPNVPTTTTIDQLLANTNYTVNITARALLNGTSTGVGVIPPAPTVLYNMRLTKQSADTTNFVTKNFDHTVVTGVSPNYAITIPQTTVIGGPIKFTPGFITFTNLADPNVVVVTGAQVFLDIVLTSKGISSTTWILIGLGIFLLILFIILIIYLASRSHRDKSYVVNTSQSQAPVPSRSYVVNTTSAPNVTS